MDTNNPSCHSVCTFEKKFHLHTARVTMTAFYTEASSHEALYYVLAEFVA